MCNKDASYEALELGNKEIAIAEGRHLLWEDIIKPHQIVDNITDYLYEEYDYSCSDLCEKIESIDRKKLLLLISDFFEKEIGETELYDIDPKTIQKKKLIQF